MRAANAIYWAAWNAGDWQSDDESTETLANVGAEFLQMADELERDQSWRIWHCDSTAVLLRRPAKDSSDVPVAGASGSCSPAAH